MNIKIISAIAVTILIIVLAIQNVATVTLKVFSWEINGSLSLFLILSILSGVIIGAVFALLFRKKEIKQKPAENDKPKPASGN